MCMYVLPPVYRPVSHEILGIYTRIEEEHEQNEAEEQERVDESGIETCGG